MREGDRERERGGEIERGRARVRDGESEQKDSRHCVRRCCCREAAHNKEVAALARQLAQHEQALQSAQVVQARQLAQHEQAVQSAQAVLARIHQEAADASAQSQAALCVCLRCAPETDRQTDRERGEREREREREREICRYHGRWVRTACSEVQRKEMASLEAAATQRQDELYVCMCTCVRACVLV